MLSSRVAVSSLTFESGRKMLSRLQAASRYWERLSGSPVGSIRYR
jgi:hypothetical protein